MTWVRVDPQPVAAARLLALEVARISGTPADEVRVVHSCPRCGSSEHGTPVVVAPREPALSVSLSRAPGAVVVAVSTVGPVGVDLELPDAARFAGFERVALHEREHAPTVEARATTWVRKESLLKATGQGLHLDPGTIRISGAREAPAARRVARNDSSAGRADARPGAGRLRRVSDGAGGTRAESHGASGRSGSSSWVSHASKNSFRSSPVVRSAKSMNISVETVLCACSATQSRSSSKNSLVPERQPQCVQQQRAPLVDPVVEHQRRGPGSPSTRSCRRPRGVASARRRARAPRPPGLLRPQPLGVAGEALRAARCPASGRGSGCCRTTGATARGRPAALPPSPCVRKLAPNVDSPCASSGISSSSSVTTTV